MSKLHTSPAYYEYNRIKTGLNHVSYGRATFSHISKQRWEEIFGPKNARSDTGKGRLKENPPQES